MLEAWKIMTRSEQGTNLMIGDVFRRSGRRGFLLQDGKFLDRKILYARSSQESRK